MKMLLVTLGTQTGTHTHKASVLDCVCGSITDKARKNKLIKSPQQSLWTHVRACTSLLIHFFLWKTPLRCSSSLGTLKSGTKVHFFRPQIKLMRLIKVSPFSTCLCFNLSKLHAIKLPLEYTATDSFIANQSGWAQQQPLSRTHFEAKPSDSCCRDISSCLSAMLTSC